MRITRIKSLLPAPKNAELLYLVVTPSQLGLDNSSNWKDNRDTVRVEVWKQSGDDEPTQQGMGDYSVLVYKNGNADASIVKNNTSGFSFQASKTDRSFDIKLKVGSSVVQTVTVIVTSDGTNGNSVVSVTEYYLASSAASGITTETEGWTTDSTDAAAKITEAKKYLWNYEKITYSNDTSASTNPVIIGRYGDKGDGIRSITEYYLATSANTGVTRSTSGWTIDPKATAATLTETNRYLWNYERITFTDGSYHQTDPVIIGVHGDNGVGVSSVVEYYLASADASGVTAETSGWTTVPTDTAAKLTETNKYLWNYEKITYSNGTSASTNPVIIGMYGGKGVGIRSITEYYLATSANTGVTRMTSGWTTSPTATAATLTETNKYLWNFEKVTYTDGTSDETDPVIIGVYGERGQDGKDGTNGPGIASTTWYYLATTMATGVTRSTVGWTSSYQQGTPDLPYVWRYGDTLLSNGKHTYTDCELIFSYSAGANPNLLEQTNFSSLAAMDSWINKGGISSRDGQNRTSNLQITTGTQAHNAIRDFLVHGGDVVNYEELLVQCVTGSKRKLEPGTWYTLSFWMKGTHNRTMSIYSGGYGYAVSGTKREIWLEAGHTYRFTATGYINRNGNSDVCMRIYGWGPLDASNPWENFAYAEISSSSSTTVTFDITAPVSGIYGLESYVWPDEKRTGNEYGYVSGYTVVDMTCLIMTIIYPNIVDTAVQGYVDGVRKTLDSDCTCLWPESSEWVRHTCTFKTKSNMSVTAQGYVLWRIPPCIRTNLTKDVYVCMPKLEVGMQATSYISNEEATHFGQPRRRRWAVNTQYFQGAIDERYDDVVLVGERGFYHCIKSHISTEDNMPGVGANWQTYWTSANSAMFDFLATDIFFAEKALINNLIATLIQTGYSGSPHIEAEGSEFKIFGKGQYPAIYLAVNSNNQAVLRFQNEDTGEYLYDLGPEGIMKEFSEVADTYTEVRLKKLTSVTRVSEILNIATSACSTYYRFNEGYKQIGSGDSVTKQYHISGGSLPSIKNAQYFTTEDYNGTRITDGWYVMPNNGSYMQMISKDNGDIVFMAYIYQFSNGKLAASVPVYFKNTDSYYAQNSVGCDENGNELSTSTYTYLYSYWQSIPHNL